MNKLLDDEIMIELLRWEVADGNHITERTSRLRELHILELINKYSDAIRGKDLSSIRTAPRSRESTSTPPRGSTG